MYLSVAFLECVCLQVHADIFVYKLRKLYLENRIIFAFSLILKLILIYLLLTSVSIRTGSDSDELLFQFES